MSCLLSAMSLLGGPGTISRRIGEHVLQTSSSAVPRVLYNVCRLVSTVPFSPGAGTASSLIKRGCVVSLRASPRFSCMHCSPPSFPSSHNGRPPLESLEQVCSHGREYSSPSSTNLAHSSVKYKVLPYPIGTLLSSPPNCTISDQWQMHLQLSHKTSGDRPVGVLRQDC